MMKDSKKQNKYSSLLNGGGLKASLAAVLHSLAAGGAIPVDVGGYDYKYQRARREET